MRDVYKKDLCDVVWDGSPLAKKEFLIESVKKSQRTFRRKQDLKYIQVEI